MYGDDAAHWRDDVKWIAGLLATVLTAIAVLYIGAAQLSTEERGRPLLERVLTLTLAPGGESDLDVREGIDYQPGEPLAPIAGIDVVVDATEIPSIGADDAIGRIAGVWSDRFVAGGAPAVLELVSNPSVRAQLESAFAGPVPVLVDRHLRAQMLPSGLDSGARLADWPLQVQRNPGEPVQPIVGIFIYAEPSELAARTPRQIGVLVLEGLAELVLEGGLPAARDVITNPNLATRLDAAIDVDTRASLHETFSTILLGRRSAIEARLEQARAVLAAQGEEPTGIAGVLSPEELAGLDEAERTERIVAALAERGYAEGGAALLPLLEDGAQAERVAAVVPLLDTLTQSARGAYVRRAWIFGGLAVLLLLVLVVASRGWGRMVNPGLALTFAAAGGAAAIWRLGRALGAPDATQLPLSVQAEGAFAHLAGLLAYLAVQLPRDAVELLLLHHLVVLGVGVGLVVLALAIRLIRAVRPRRRSLL